MTAARTLALRQTLIVALLFCGYASYYFCRSDFSVAMPLLADELKRSGMNADSAMVHLGSIVSLGVLAYAIGKLVLGGLGDIWGGRRNFLGGLSGAVVFTLLFTISGGLPIFTVSWIGNRFVQGMGWAGLVKVCSNWFSYKSYGTIVGILSLSFLLGDALARASMGMLLDQGYGWRALFYFASIVAGLVLAANLIFLRESRTSLGFLEPESNPLNLFHNAAPTSKSMLHLLIPFLKSPAFCLVCFLSLGTTIVRETFNTWTPTYLHKFLGYSDGAAAKASAIFPLLGAVSVILAGIAGDRLGVAGRSIVLFFGMLLTTTGLFLMTALKPGQEGSVPLILLGVVGLGLLGPYSYLAGAMALDLGGKQGGATSSALIDGIGYLGGVLAGDSVARMSVSLGWSGVFTALAAISAAAALAAFFLFLRQRVPKSASPLARTIPTS